MVCQWQGKGNLDGKIEPHFIVGISIKGLFLHLMLEFAKKKEGGIFQTVGFYLQV